MSAISSESPGWANQASTYGAEQTRRAVFLPFSSAGGVKASGDLACTAPVSGMTVNVATGEVLVPGSSSASQGLYYGKVTSTTNLAVAASNPSNPRIDMVYAAITDAAYTGATNTFVTAVATGTPTVGATLVNLTGAPALPTSAILLAYILVPATSTSVIDANILDSRVRFVISNAASTTSTSTQTFAGKLSTPTVIVTGITGAITQTRLVGGTASGAPVSGTFAVNDVVPDATGKLWICTVAGSPGTFVQVGATTSIATDQGVKVGTQSISATTLTTVFTTASLTAGTYDIDFWIEITGGAAFSYDLTCAVGSATATFTGGAQSASMYQAAATNQAAGRGLRTRCVVTGIGTILLRIYANGASTIQYVSSYNTQPGASGYLVTRVS